MSRLTVLLALTLGPALSALAEETYPGYQWSQVADGIYLHSAIDPLAGPVDGNSIVIDYGPGLCVVDTHINPAVARAVVELINDRIGKPVTHIVNTHWHDDHVNGNHAYRQAWPDAKIIAHETTLAALEREWQPMEEQRMNAYAAVEANQIREAAAALEDPFQAMGYGMYADYIEALKPELPTMELVYPDTVFDGSYVIETGGRPIEVRWLGPGNTEGDVVVHLPDDDIVISGDLIVWPIPFAFDSPMHDWINTLQAITRLNADIIIPGHGPVQHDNIYLEQVINLLVKTLEETRIAHENGASYDALEDAIDLSHLETVFTGGETAKVFAWRSYFLGPGLKSAWKSQGFPVPEE